MKVLSPLILNTICDCQANVKPFAAHVLFAAHVGGVRHCHVGGVRISFICRCVSWVSRSIQMYSKTFVSGHFSFSCIYSKKAC